MDFSKENFELLQKQNKRMKDTIAKLGSNHYSLIDQIKEEVGSINLINQFRNDSSDYYTNLHEILTSHHRWLASWENEPLEVHEMYDHMIGLIPDDIKQLIRDYKKLHNDRTARYGEYKVYVYTAKSPTGRMIKEFDNMESYQFIEVCEKIIRAHIKNNKIDELYEICIKSPMQWSHGDKGIQIWRHPSENVHAIRDFNKI